MTLSQAFRSAIERWKGIRRSTFKSIQPPPELEDAKAKLSAVLRRPSEYDRLKDKMVYSNTEQVYWLHEAGEQTGPLCPYCFRIRKTITKLTPATFPGVYFCSLHQLTFKTAQYHERLARFLP